MTVSIEDQIKCAERELAMRLRVYKRNVEMERMDPAKAQHETEAMKAIIETLKEVRDQQQGGRLL